MKPAVNQVKGMNVNAIPTHTREEDWDRYDDEAEEELPGRPRRQLLTKWSALLFAVVVGAACFYGGVRVEKNQLAGSAGTSSLAGTFASRFGAGAGAGAGVGAGAGATAAAGATSNAAATGSSGAAASGASGAGGFAGRFGALFGGGGAGTVGTVSSVDGNTIYVTETSGDTVKVKLSSVTKITKSEPVSKAKVNPGDSVVIAGVPAKNGTVTATTVTDSGDRSTGSTSTGSSSSSSGSSAISSLF